MIKSLHLFLFIFCLISYSFSQTPTQTVRGKVYDSETNFPLVGVKLEIKIPNSEPFRSISNPDGEFEIKKVPVGKHQITASYSLYESKTVTIEVNSGREMVINIPLTEAISTQEEVTVSARKKGDVINEMAVISAQQFSVEETNRYPGSRMDPARMEIGRAHV